MAPQVAELAHFAAEIAELERGAAAAREQQLVESGEADARLGHVGARCSGEGGHGAHRRESLPPR